MNKNLKTILTILVSILLAYCLLKYALKGIDLEKTKEALKNANYFYVALSVILGMMAYVFRSERWRLLLEPMGYKTKSSTAFASVSMTYFSNLFIPRSGELVRCTSLKVTENVPIDKSFGTVILERVIDFTCLLTFMFLAVIFNFDLVVKFYQEISQTTSSGKTDYTLLYILMFLGLMVLLILKLTWKKLIQNKFIQKIIAFLEGIKEGILAIKELKEKKKFIAYTVAIWVAYFFMTYLVVFALKESSDITLSQGLFLLVVGGFGMVIPASGGIGAYHAAMQLGFITLGLSGELGLVFGFLVHTPHTLIALVFGLISMVIISINKKKIDGKA